MNNPKFEIGQQVKFINDHDRMTGKVLEFSYNSITGFSYKISSKYYDPNKNDMAEGYKSCQEDELVDMSDYDGTTTPEIPDKTVDVTDSINTSEGKVA